MHDLIFFAQLQKLVVVTVEEKGKMLAIKMSSADKRVTTEWFRSLLAPTCEY